MKMRKPRGNADVIVVDVVKGDVVAYLNGSKVGIGTVEMHLRARRLEAEMRSREVVAE